MGTTKLYVNDKAVAEGPMKTQPGKFTLSGDGLCVGYDSGDAVSKEYKTPGTFKGGTIQGVGVTRRKGGLRGPGAGSQENHDAQLIGDWFAALHEQRCREPSQRFINCS